MRQDLEISNQTDENGNPTGGTVVGAGISIQWQDGPLGTGADRVEPTGAFVEGVIQAGISRLEFFQASKFASSFNESALNHLRMALAALEERTAEREARGVEGTHTV